jgi:hypothetical protein
MFYNTVYYRGKGKITCNWICVKMHGGIACLSNHISYVRVLIILQTQLFK